MANTDYNAVSTVMASQYRKQAIEALNHPKTPSQIAEESDGKIAHISRALQELREIEVVELLVDEDKQKGRLYGRTEKGENVIESLEDWNNE